MNKAISPLDGRYHDKLRHLSVYFSEHALFQYRVKVEVFYFIEFLEKILKVKISNPQLKFLHSIYLNFSDKDSAKIKDIEKTTRHDVKAVEYFIKNKLEETRLNRYSEFVHFGLTSQDINNTATPMLIQDATKNELIPVLNKLIEQLRKMGRSNNKISMLARTHGQPATPTTLGKELNVFVERLSNQLAQLKSFKISGKFGGATGNLNAHAIAYPKVNWPRWADQFLKNKLSIQRQKTTTQIAHYDELAEYCHILIRINTILLDFSKDMWSYISMEYFTQQIKSGEIGSSAMPHKVNPIDFENAEGNLGIANSLLSHLAEKLPISRLQRDLTDSTVLRNIGTPISHMYLSCLSLLNGLQKVKVNSNKIKQDLGQNWIILAEAIQTILRRERVKGAYEMLKDLTRGKAAISKQDLHNFINSLKISDKVKSEMLKLTPYNYIGFARKL